MRAVKTTICNFSNMLTNENILKTMRDDVKLIKLQQKISQNQNQKLNYHYIKFCVLNQMHFFKNILPIFN